MSQSDSDTPKPKNKSFSVFVPSLQRVLMIGLHHFSCPSGHTIRTPPLSIDRTQHLIFFFGIGYNVRPTACWFGHIY
jgi:hypothetical protein